MDRHRYDYYRYLNLLHMIIAISSILFLTLTIWLANKKLPVQVCPICAGTTLTWLWIFAGLSTGKLSTADFQMPLAILAGGTVVGAMSKLEAKIKTESMLVWKTLFVMSGFGAVYGLVSGKWALIIGGVILNAVITLVFKKPISKANNGSTKELEEKMKGCC
jgi:hypothetical protein